MLAPKLDIPDRRDRRRPPAATTLVVLATLVAGCSHFDYRSKALVPTRHQTRTGPYVVFTNGPIDADHPAIRHLSRLERELQAKLAVRADAATAPIEVYVLDDSDAFSHFLRFHYPDLPPRRAFFLAQGERRVVYTFMSEHLEEDLRHEATHALLHAAVSELPLWLDEGLAEYFEVPEELDGRNEDHMRRLPADLAAGWTPDLKALEALTDVRRMTPRDYRESWLWVHEMLDGPRADRAALLGYLADIREDPAARPLSDRLAVAGGGNDPSERLTAHLEALRRKPPVLVASTDRDVARSSIERFQSGPGDSVPASPRKRSLVGRFFGIFGL